MLVASGDKKICKEIARVVEKLGQVLGQSRFFGIGWRWSKETLVDRLSALPDCLIIHILSRLEVKQSAITALLSKRWQFLWTQSPRLIFIQKSDADIQDFVSRVNRTLVIYEQNDLDTFEVEFPYSKSYSPDVDVWVGFAVKSKAKQVSLLLNQYFDDEEEDEEENKMYTLPRTMFRCAQLKRLTLRGCVVAPLGTIEWPSLTELSIEDSKLEQHVMGEMLSGCPVLRCLVLICCWGFTRLEVSSKSLYELRVSDPEHNEEGSFLELEPFLQISAPYLHNLSVTLCPKQRKLCLENTSSLVKATLDFVIGDWESREDRISDAKELFEKIRHVKVVHLGYIYMEVCVAAIKNYRFPQSAQTCLTVKVVTKECCIHVLLGLLESSPNLESLVIEGDGAHSNWGPCTCLGSKTDLDCDLLHLKSIVIKDFIDKFKLVGGEPMLTLAKILLNKAPALEKMVVHDKIFKSSSKSAVNRPFKIAQKLLSYPGSSKAVILLK
ncbi:hypothetical protein CASFOL_035425 [Castilleja foliolosa]|uniref:F-box domain-containing protein n=1 Tax=Castilleja foliolosa TaxID=1961234 RepID=A0ABD3BSS4_9LAMI